MIAITQDSTKLPFIPDAESVPELESWSGCDIAVSRLDMSMSKLGLFREHVESGACLLQVKIGMDLPSSIADHRLSLSLARMREVAPNAAQRWLVFVGILTNKEQDGAAWIDGRKVSESVPGVDYKACQTALRRWNMRGGRYINVARISDLVSLLEGFERDLIEMHDKPTLDVYPDKTVLMEECHDDPFQHLKRINDWRVMLVSAGVGIGPFMANELFKQSGGNFAWAMDRLTCIRDAERLPGWTINRCNKFRIMCGLEPNQCVGSVSVHDKEKEY